MTVTVLCLTELCLILHGIMVVSTENNLHHAEYMACKVSLLHPFLCCPLPHFQNESFVVNHSNENEFDLHENGRVGEIHG